MGRGAHTVDAAQPHTPLLRLEAGLEMALLASNISRKSAHTVDAAQPYMPILGLKAGLERVLLAPNILTKGQSDWLAGVHTLWM